MVWTLLRDSKVYTLRLRLSRSVKETIHVITRDISDAFAQIDDLRAENQSPIGKVRALEDKLRTDSDIGF